jgi:hypothetical protein
VIAPPIVLPPVDSTGSVIIQGPTCYDIAQTEGGLSCGSLSARQPNAAFPNQAQRTRTYFLVLQETSNIKDLRVGWTNDNDGIIQSVTGNVSGSLTQSRYAVTVVFADDINNIVKGTAGKKSTVLLYAVYDQGGTDKSVSLRITVQDCSCCPLDVAMIMPDAAYEGPDIFDTEQALSTQFALIPNAALCVFSSDQGYYNTATRNPENSWEDANNHCANSMTAYGEDWRLPNVAELYFKLHNENVLPTKSTNNDRYWSSTGKTGAYGDTKIYTLLSYSSQKYSTLVLSERKDQKKQINFRCVKTIAY